MPNEINRTNSILPWVAVIIALAALGVAILAWNNSNNSPLQRQLSNLEMSTTNLSQQMAIQDLKQRLQQISDNLKNNSNYEQAQMDIAGAQESLKANFKDVQSQAHQSWLSVDQQLNSIQIMLRSKSNQAIVSIGNLINNLKNFKFGK